MTNEELTKTEELYQTALEAVLDGNNSSYICLMSNGDILSSPVSIPEAKIEIDMNSFYHFTVADAVLTDDEWEIVNNADDERAKEFELKSKALIDDGYYYELAREAEENIQ